MEATLTARLRPAATSRERSVAHHLSETGATHDGDFPDASIEPNAAMTRLTGQL